MRNAELGGQRSVALAESQIGEIASPGSGRRVSTQSSLFGLNPQSTSDINARAACGARQPSHNGTTLLKAFSDAVANIKRIDAI